MQKTRQLIIMKVTVSIVYEYLEGNSVYVSYIEMCDHTVNNDTSFLVSNNASDFGTIKPVVSSTKEQRLIVYKRSPSSNLNYRIRTYSYTFYKWIWGSAAYDIPDTDQYSINPSIVGNKIIQEHHIVYQQGTSVIKYKHADYKDLDELRFCQDTVVSENCGFTINQNPSVSVAWISPLYHQVQISWQGIQHNVLDKIIAKEEEYGLWRYEAVTRLKSDSSWSSFRNFGSNVKYVQSGSLNATDGAIIVWSESNGLYSKYVKRNSGTNYSTTQNLSTNGIYTLVSNGDTFGDIKAVVFNNLTSEPYLLNKCTNDFSQLILSKDGDTETIDISYRRAGVIGKNSIEFLFNIGDVILNNETIKFIEKNDTLPITSTDQLNQTVRTESFYLNPQSELLFSNYYYVVDKANADSALSDQFNVTFKCELVNEATNQVAPLIM